MIHCCVEVDDSLFGDKEAYMGWRIIPIDLGNLTKLLYKRNKVPVIM